MTGNFPVTYHYVTTKGGGGGREYRIVNYLHPDPVYARLDPALNSMLKPPFYSFLIANNKSCQLADFRQQGAVLSDSLYRKVCRLCGENEDWSHTSINLEVRDQRVSVIFDWLATEGCLPSFQSRVDIDAQNKSFAVGTFWKPTPKQLIDAEYFQITTLSHDSSNVGTLLGIDSDHLAHIAADKGQWKRPQELAEIRERIFIASERLRQKFTQEKLIGLQLNELQWYYQAPGFGWDEVDPIDDPRGRKWVTSDVIMPACLTPRRYSDGPKVGEIVKDKRPSHHHNYDSEGLAPAILRFKRSDVEKLGKFDLAITRECTHQTKEYMGPNEPLGFRDADYWMPDIIVSRRFKEWFSKSGLHGCRKIDYRLVELV